MLAEALDAVVGIDTHRNTHEAEIELPTGAPIATCSISTDSSGCTELLERRAGRCLWWAAGRWLAEADIDAVAEVAR
jgi:hypothetical protein